MGKQILVAAGAMLLVYLMGAFIAADFNIANWSGMALSRKSASLF